MIQESALISDAVSSSNAVGFWQFKEASATEVGMRVDRQVDERMNIVASTAGAAKYLLRSNSTFNNWLYSVQSYQMGLGGASRSLNNRYYGANEMRIDGDTYWYVKKFLSHLIAFRDAVGKQPRNLVLYQHKNCANKTLEDIALELNAQPELLTEYNKWLKTSRVPDDREYVVIVPVHIDEAPDLLAENRDTAKDQKNKKNRSLEDKLFGEKQKEPDVPNAVRDRLAITKVELLLKRYLAAPAVEATIFIRSSTWRSTRIPTSVAEASLNCQKPTAFELETASEIRALSWITRYLISSGTPCSARMGSIIGRYMSTRSSFI